MPKITASTETIPEGFWILQKSKCGWIQLAVFKKPSKLRILVTKLLLGWAWQSNAKGVRDYSHD